MVLRRGYAPSPLTLVGLYPLTRGLGEGGGRLDVNSFFFRNCPLVHAYMADGPAKHGNKLKETTP